MKLAPEVGLEPTTTRLTAACSTIELLWNANGHIIYEPPRPSSISFLRIFWSDSLRLPGQLRLFRRPKGHVQLGIQSHPTALKFQGQRSVVGGLEGAKLEDAGV